MSRHAITHGTKSSSLADILERVLDKGVVIAGDIKIKLVEIELLTIQIRLVVCSVERAVEMGICCLSFSTIKFPSNTRDPSYPP